MMMEMEMETVDMGVWAGEQVLVLLAIRTKACVQEAMRNILGN